MIRVQRIASSQQCLSSHSRMMNHAAITSHIQIGQPAHDRFVYFGLHTPRYVNAPRENTTGIRTDGANNTGLSSTIHAGRCQKWGAAQCMSGGSNRPVGDEISISIMPDCGCNGPFLYITDHGPARGRVATRAACMGDRPRWCVRVGSSETTIVGVPNDGAREPQIAANIFSRPA